MNANQSIINMNVNKFTEIERILNEWDNIVRYQINDIIMGQTYQYTSSDEDIDKFVKNFFFTKQVEKYMSFAQQKHLFQENVSFAQQYHFFQENMSLKKTGNDLQTKFNDILKYLLRKKQFYIEKLRKGNNSLDTIDKYFTFSHPGFVPYSYYYHHQTKNLKNFCDFRDKFNSNLYENTDYGMRYRSTSQRTEIRLFKNMITNIENKRSDLINESEDVNDSFTNLSNNSGLLSVVLQTLQTDNFERFLSKVIIEETEKGLLEFVPKIKIYNYDLKYNVIREIKSKIMSTLYQKNYVSIISTISSSRLEYGEITYIKAIVDNYMLYIENRVYNLVKDEFLKKVYNKFNDCKEMIEEGLPPFPEDFSCPMDFIYAYCDFYRIDFEDYEFHSKNGDQGGY